MIRKFAIFLSSLIFSAVCLADTVYVDDTLRVGVRAKPDRTLPSLVVIKSGAAVELLEKKGSYAKIRTSNGIEGWVKSAYLSGKQPTANKLKAAKEQIEQLKKQIEEVKASSNASADAQLKSLQEKFSALQRESITLKNQLANAKRNGNTTIANEETTINRSIAIDFKNLNKDTLYLVIGVIVVLLSLGFLFGVSWYKKQVTKRLGGLSI